MISVKRKIQIRSVAHGARTLAVATEAPVERPLALAGRVPRVARLVALAVRFERQIRAGVVRDQSELARQCQVTQPRMTQIMNLALLAPAIQEQILSLPRVQDGRDPVTERMLRRIAGEPCWQRQAEMWQRIAPPMHQ
jgi:hypothetical protein